MADPSLFTAAAQTLGTGLTGILRQEAASGLSPGRQRALRKRLGRPEPRPQAPAALDQFGDRRLTPAGERLRQQTQDRAFAALAVQREAERVQVEAAEQERIAGYRSAIKQLTDPKGGWLAKAQTMRNPDAVAAMSSLALRLTERMEEGEPWDEAAYTNQLFAAVQRGAQAVPPEAVRADEGGALEWDGAGDLPGGEYSPKFFRKEVWDPLRKRWQDFESIHETATGDVEFRGQVLDEDYKKWIKDNYGSYAEFARQANAAEDDFRRASEILNGFSAERERERTATANQEFFENLREMFERDSTRGR